MNVDLFIKKMPQAMKDLISREAFENRRSLNQEAIALLEEALLSRVGTTVGKRKQIAALLESYADLGSAARASDATSPGVPVAPPAPVHNGPQRTQ